MTAEIGRLRYLLDLLPPDTEVSEGETGGSTRSGGIATAVTYVVQESSEEDVLQLGAFTTIHEAVKAVDLAQSADPTAEWVVNVITTYDRAMDYLRDR